MTAEDMVYGAWLDILGSGMEESTDLHESLHRLHEAAVGSHLSEEDPA